MSIAFDRWPDATTGFKKMNATAKRAELVQALRISELNLIYTKNSFVFGETSYQTAHDRAQYFGAKAAELVAQIVRLTFTHDLEPVDLSRLCGLFEFFGLSKNIKF